MMYRIGRLADSPAERTLAGTLERPLLFAPLASFCTLSGGFRVRLVRLVGQNSTIVAILRLLYVTNEAVYITRRVINP